MKVFARLVPLILLVFCMAASGLAEDKATKDEVTAKVQEAVKMAEEKGLEETLAVVNDKNGPFVWKDSYVMAMNMQNETVVAHPFTPALIGKNLMGVKDVNGKLFFAEMMNVGKEKGQGWVDYMWPKPGQKEPSPKHGYLMVVPGTDVIFLAGTYD